MAWVVLLVCAAVMVYCLRYLYRLFFPVTLWNGPKPDAQQEKQASHRMTDLLIKYPDLHIIAKNYPKEASTAEAVREYQVLNDLLANGRISEEEYNARLEHVSAKIDLSDI